MTDHDDFDRSLSERLRAHEARVPGGAAPDLATIGSRSVRERPAWGWGALVVTGGVAAGLLLVLLLGGRLQPPTGQETATPQPTSSASGSVAPSASVAPSPPSLSSLPGLIAFSRDGDVYTMRPDGTAVTRLTDDATAVEIPIAWLADGSRLVLLTTANDNSYASTVSLVRPDGSEAVDLGVVHPIYSPPTFSPDGTRIAFGGDGGNLSGIAVVDVVHGVFVQLTTDGGLGWDALNGPLWSQDGSRIFYQALDSTYTYVSWFVTLDGTPPVAWNEDITLVPPTRTSPDGHWTASICPGGLCLTRTDGGGTPRVLEPGIIEPGANLDLQQFSPSWSPDGGYFAYAGSGGINVVSLPDGDPITITPPGVSDSAPVWQPVQG